MTTQQYNICTGIMDLEVLNVIKQYVSNEDVDVTYIRNNILPGFFHNFWIRMMALNPDSYKQVVETTVELAKKVGAADIVGRIVQGLKDEDEAYRRMVMETIGKVLADLGASDIDACLEELLIHGILYAFKVQTSDDANVVLDAFCAVVKSLGQRMKPYILTTCLTVKWCFIDMIEAKLRKQAADAISGIAMVLKQCEAEELMRDLGVVLFARSFLRKENPEVVAASLGALKAMDNFIDMTRVIPQLRYLIPRDVQDLNADMRDLSFSE